MTEKKEDYPIFHIYSNNGMVDIDVVDNINSIRDGEPPPINIVVAGNNGQATANTSGVAFAGYSGTATVTRYGIAYAYKGANNHAISGPSGIAYSLEGTAQSTDGGISIIKYSNQQAVVGKTGIAIAIAGGKVSGDIGSVLILGILQPDGTIKYYAKIVGLDNIKPGILYTLDNNNEFIESL